MLKKELDIEEVKKHLSYCPTSELAMAARTAAKKEWGFHENHC